MQNTFWHKTDGPLLISAPMSNVTDAVMRRMMALYGKPDIIFTEFVSVAGLCSPGRKKLVYDLRFREDERPIVAQLFGKNPEHFLEASRLMRELGFDGVDINLGCPDKMVLKQGAGSALIEQSTLVAEIVQAAKEGSGLPVSVKTRTGHKEDNSEDWIESLAAMGPAAITLHGRTVTQMYHGLANWESIGRAARVAAKHGIPFIGNGDVQTRQEALEKSEAYGLQGVMVGRALMGNPWFFHPGISRDSRSQKEILAALLEHAMLYEELYPGRFKAVRKHIKSYVHDFPSARALRHELVQTSTPGEVRAIIEAYLETESEIQQEDALEDTGNRTPGS
jgi:tRNA-dihydrouridine synthase B